MRATTPPRGFALIRTVARRFGRGPRRVAWLGDRGAAMVEFALVATPFIFLLFAIVELGLIFVADICLDNTSFQIARQVRVGTTVLPGATVTSGTGSQMTLSSFKNTICAGIPLLSNATCLNQLQADIRTQSAFTGQTVANPISGTNFTNSGFCFYSGQPGDIVTMHVYLLWPVTTPLLLKALVQINSITTGGGTASGSYFLLNASQVFKNEPNSTATNTGNGC